MFVFYFVGFSLFSFFFLGLKAVDNYIDLKKVIKQLLHYTRQRVSLKVFSCKQNKHIAYLYPSCRYKFDYPCWIVIIGVY